jgi:hypothetical protein
VGGEVSYVVYLLLNAQGETIYVGFTGNLEQRLANHRANKSWWSEVDRVSSEPYETRHDAWMAEKRAITAHSPRYNVNHVPGGDLLTTAEAAKAMNRGYDWARRLLKRFEPVGHRGSVKLWSAEQVQAIIDTPVGSVPATRDRNVILQKVLREAAEERLIEESKPSQIEEK